MDAKDRLFKNIVIKMSSKLDDEELRYLKNVLVCEMENYKIEMVEEEKQLPSVYTERNIKLINMFLSCKKIEGKSQKTIDGYLQTMKHFLSMFDVDLLNVNVNTIRMYFINMEQRGNCSVSLNNKRKKLSVFFEWLVEEEYIQKNPVKKIKRVKEEIKVKKPYNDVEVAKLYDSCKSTKQRALLDLLLTTGCRNEEVCEIKLDDVDFTQKQILIHGKGAKQREVFLNDTCIYYLEQYLMDREMKGIHSKYLFCNERRRLECGRFVSDKMKTESLRRIMKNLAKNAGVDSSTVHRYRNTFCCNMLNHSDLLTVQYLMGHSNPKTTVGYSTLNKQKARFEHSKL
ncbi:MAG: tyrosine-type recombinase/integrase [Bacilli bacterium]|nr:tyrosine-type recombinase/integrase [Bacilli bacterium]